MKRTLRENRALAALRCALDVALASGAGMSISVDGQRFALSADDVAAIDGQIPSAWVIAADNQQSGHVYIARLESSGRYKIGFSGTLRQRAKQLAAAYGERVTMLCATPGTTSDERKLLCKFRRYADGKRRQSARLLEVFVDRDGEIARYAATQPAVHITAEPSSYMPRTARAA